MVERKLSVLGVGNIGDGNRQSDATYIEMCALAIMISVYPMIDYKKNLSSTYYHFSTSMPVALIISVTYANLRPRE